MQTENNLHGNDHAGFRKIRQLRLKDPLAAEQGIKKILLPSRRGYVTIVQLVALWTLEVHPK